MSFLAISSKIVSLGEILKIEAFIDILKCKLSNLVVAQKKRKKEKLSNLIMKYLRPLLGAK